MAHTPSDSGSAGNASTLARGKACLRCRKRKMRCDGAKPACAQCVRALKPDVCVYDDGRGRTRTQALREKIARLEEEIAQLRDPASAAGLQAQSVFLHDPHPHAQPSATATTTTTSSSSSSAAAAASAASRPATAQGLVGSSSASPLFDFGSFEFAVDSAEAGERGYSGGVQRTLRPASGVFGYSCNHPLAQGQYAHGRGSAGPSSAGSSPLGSPSPSTVGSAGLSVGGSGASPFSSFSDSINSPPVNSPSAGYALPRTLSPDAVEVPPDMCYALLDIFLSHRHQAGFALHVARLCTSLGYPPPPPPSPSSAYQCQAYPAQSEAPPTRTGAGAQPRHPVLLHAMLLWASLLARGTPLDAHERTFLARTQAALADALTVSQFPAASALGGPENGVGGACCSGMGMGMGAVAPATAALDALQASVLLARYFFACARLTEASYHASAAADLAVQCGLHQLRGGGAPFALGVYGEYGPYALGAEQGAGADGAGYEYVGLGMGMGMGMGVGAGVGAPALRLAPPADAVELGERVGVFWQVYVLDRLLSVALRRPPCIADDSCVETRIDTPWPEDVEEYEHIPIESVRGDSTLRAFFLNQGQPTGAPGGFSLLALRVKAAALYSAAARTAANGGARPPCSSSSSPSCASASAPADSAAAATPALETALARLAGALLPAHQLGAALPAEDRRAHVQLHTLAHAARVLLHVRRARAGERGSAELCVHAARAAALLARRLVEEDYAFLDPVFGPCWTTIASVFSLEQVQVQVQVQARGGAVCAAWAAHDRDLDTLLAAIARLGARFPIMGM